MILVVEDDPTLRLLARHVLAHLGYDCVTVSSGEEAVERVKGDIALIFMDIGLPGIDGTRAATLIREKELNELQTRRPIIALTAHSDRERCIKAGMDDYLLKPAFMADWQRMLEKWLA